jgi:aldose 1-epimerase
MSPVEPFANQRSATGEAPLVFEAGGVRAVVEPAVGGRVTSLVVDGDELLWTERADGPIRWGSYPMAPWAGRVRRGRFAFAGREHRLPLGMPPHAIHGTVYDRAWTHVDDATLGIELGDGWPFRGRVMQRFALDADGLEATLILEADEPMPAAVGWHPWFRRRLGSGAGDAELRFAADEILVRDAEGIPSGERVAPGVGPWDDAFTGVREGPEITWPGRLRLALTSSCPWWVVYTEPEHALCVEPQSGPPDALNSGAEVVRPGSPLVHTMRWTWARLRG